jgi:competence protein ComEA
VDLNTATAAELDTLPGVGPSTAAKIVADRTSNGPFRSVDDLMRVSGIGPAKFDSLKDLVRVE